MEQMRHSPFNKKCMPIQKSAMGDVLGRFVDNAVKRKELLPLPFEVYWSVAFAPLYQLTKFHVQGRSMVNEKFEMNDKIMTEALRLVLKALKPEN
jgi:hypothetical protein